MAAGHNIKPEQKKYIYDNYQIYTAQEIAINLHLSRETIWKYLRKKELKCKRRFIRRSIVLDRQIVARVLESFCNNGYSVKLAAECNGLTYQKASWYIKHYFTKKRLSESTEIITKQSAV